MNIKSLLLGSAAALVAVTGARAADAVVVAEPEPVEYVRVCDVYGAGFYYIPGTETCMKVGSYIRYDIGVGALGHQDVDNRNSEDDDNDLNDTFYKKARFAIRFDARTETELGTLRGYGAIKFDRTTSDVGGVVYTSTSQDLDHAYIELGGFRIGKTDSLFDTFTGSAGDVINDGIVPYAPGGTHQISYTFTGGNGFTAMVGLEEGNSGDVYVDADGDEHKALFTLDSYIPHVLAGVGYTAGWGGVSFVGAYDFGLGRVRRQGSRRREGDRDDLCFPDGWIQVFGRHRRPGRGRQSCFLRWSEQLRSMGRRLGDLGWPVRQGRSEGYRQCSVVL